MKAEQLVLLWPRGNGMDEKCCVPFFPFCVQQSMQGSFQLLSPLFDYIGEEKTTGKKAGETLLNFVMRLSHTRKGCSVSFQNCSSSSSKVLLKVH